MEGGAEYRSARIRDAQARNAEADAADGPHGRRRSGDPAGGGLLMSLSLVEAQSVIQAAHQQATADGLRVTVAVVDEGGHLIALGRMDGAPPLSPQIAEAKAVGAAVWHRDGDSLVQVQQDRGAFFAQVDRLVRMPLIPAQGSVLVRRGDRVVGAVGVSGAAPTQDKACAEAGLRVIGL
jgi:glc operon protein GlcG